MLLQALSVEIEMKNLNLQVTFQVQKGVETRSHTKKRCGNAVPTRSHPTSPFARRPFQEENLEWKQMNNWFIQSIDPTHDWVNERNHIEGTTYLAH